MKADISTWMMIFFILFLVISIYKVYAFLPNKPLEDDDTTKEAQEELQRIMIKVIKQNDTDLDVKKLFELMKDNEEFDKKRFWRFNENRLNRLLSLYSLKNNKPKSIKDIRDSLNN